jgi:hypothetical protein
VPDEPRRGVRVGEEIATPEPPTREPTPAQTTAPSEVSEQARQVAPPIPAPPDWAANFAAESIDREWAPRAETQIVSRFAEQPGLRMLALQVECRTTMCKVLLTQPVSWVGEPPVDLLKTSEMQPPMDLLKTSGMQLLSLNALNSQPSMLTSVAYVARPGHEPLFRQRQSAADPPEPVPAR